MSCDTVCPVYPSVCRLLAEKVMGFQRSFVEGLVGIGQGGTDQFPRTGYRISATFERILMEPKFAQGWILGERSTTQILAAIRFSNPDSWLAQESGLLNRIAAVAF